MPYKEILISVLGFISAFLIIRIQFQNEKIKNIQNQLSEKKHQVFSEAVNIIFDLFNGGKIGKPLKEDVLLKRILNLKKELFIYSSDEIFKAYTKWTLSIKNNEGKTDHFKYYFDMLVLIRKEMGNKNTELSIDDFMLFLMQDKDEYEKFKKVNNW